MRSQCREGRSALISEHFSSSKSKLGWNYSRKCIPLCTVKVPEEKGYLDYDCHKRSSVTLVRTPHPLNLADGRIRTHPVRGYAFHLHFILLFFMPSVHA